MKLNLESFISHCLPEFPSANLLLKVNSVLEAHGLGCFQSHIMERVDQGCFLDIKATTSLDFLWTLLLLVLFCLPALNLSVVGLELQFID